MMNPELMMFSKQSCWHHVLKSGTMSHMCRAVLWCKHVHQLPSCRLRRRVPRHTLLVSLLQRSLHRVLTLLRNNASWRVYRRQAARTLHSSLGSCGTLWRGKQAATGTQRQPMLHINKD
jgi:hypothetical protein